MINEAILSCEWDTPTALIFSDNVFGNLVYYAHLTPLILSFALGLFVLLRDRKALLNRLLFTITTLFSVWVFFDLILWATDKPLETMFYWPIINLIEPIIYIVSIYFLYVFVENKDIPVKLKNIFFLILLPIIVFTPTRLALQGFDLTNCDREVVEGPLVYYGYALETIVIIWIFIYGFRKFREAKDSSKKHQILLATTGLFLFLFSFAIGNLVGSLNVDWTLGQYGLFGMPIFIAFLGYLISRYNTLNTKLFTAQITSFLTFTLVFSLLFIRTINNVHIIVIPTLVILLALSVVLVRSVKREITQRERLQILTTDLETTNEKLKGLDKLKTEFLSLASHQLRSPLTAIKGYTSMLLEGSFGAINDGQKQAVDRVFQSVQHLTKVVEDLLNVSKIEQGGMQYIMTPFDMEGPSKDITTDLSITAKNKGLVLTFATDNQGPYTVKGDSEKMRQVILNLIDNSIKYTQTGSISVYLAKNPVLQKVRLSIKDTGMGMTEETRNSLFQKFNRGEGAKVNAGGSGLGLYLAKQIIEAHNGRVWVESQGPGTGSTFYIELSLA